MDKNIESSFGKLDPLLMRYSVWDLDFTDENPFGEVRLREICPGVLEFFVQGDIFPRRTSSS